MGLGRKSNARHILSIQYQTLRGLKELKFSLNAGEENQVGTRKKVKLLSSFPDQNVFHILG